MIAIKIDTLNGLTAYQWTLHSFKFKNCSAVSR